MRKFETASVSNKLRKGAGILLSGLAMSGAGAAMTSAQETAQPSRAQIKFCLDSLVGNPHGIPTNTQDKTPINLRVSGASSAAQKRLISFNLHPTSQKTLRETVSPDCDGVAVKRSADVTVQEDGQTIYEVDNFLRPKNDNGQELSRSFREQVDRGADVTAEFEYSAVNPQTGMRSESHDVLQVHLGR
jgi:hypothetical protein